MVFRQQFFNLKNSRGVAVLPTVLIFSGVIIGLVLTGIFIAQIVNQSTFSERLAAEAEAGARAAVNDFYLRLLRGQISPLPVCGNEPPASYDSLTIGGVAPSLKACQRNCGAPALNACGFWIEIEINKLFVKKKFIAKIGHHPVTGRLVLTDFLPAAF